MEYKRNCPKCGDEIVYSTKWNIKRANTENRLCKTCTDSKLLGHYGYWNGKSHTDETKEKISNNLIDRYVQHESPHWKGIGDMSGRMFGSIKANARTRNIQFAVTKEYVWELFIKQNRRCAISNMLLAMRTKTNDVESGTASLDRIDNTIGYIEGNVQWVHKDINIMKNTHTQEYFIQLCKQVASNN